MPSFLLKTYTLFYLAFFKFRYAMANLIFSYLTFKGDGCGVVTFKLSRLRS